MYNPYSILLFQRNGKHFDDHYKAILHHFSLRGARQEETDTRACNHGLLLLMVCPHSFKNLSIVPQQHTTFEQTMFFATRIVHFKKYYFPEIKAQTLAPKSSVL